MQAYLNLLHQIMTEGETVATRAFLPSENRQPTARTILAAQFRHDLADGFPAVTSKKLYFDSVVKEILWFLRGETNVATLGCKIWDSWPGKQEGLPAGECGPIYGSQWRSWPYASDSEGTPLWQSASHRGDHEDVFDDYFDQVGQVVKDLKAVHDDPFHPARRRILLTGWNPPLVPLMGLPPCHTMAQFLPTNGRLHCHCFWRSIDAFTGMPFNVASYALLTHLFAAVAGYEPGTICASITDLHIYDNQFAMVEEQLTREPFPHPTLAMDWGNRKELPDLTIDAACRLDPSMFRLEGYKCHPPLRCEVAV
jgi:thymidylate synthase